MQSLEFYVEDDVPDDVLMAEASMMATYMYTQEPLLDMPISAIIGKHDLSRQPQ